MDKTPILFAKAAGLLKNFQSINWSTNNRTDGVVVDHLFSIFNQVQKDLVAELPDLFGDMALTPLPEPLAKNSNGIGLYHKHHLEPIIHRLEYILEVRSAHRIGEKLEEENRPKRVFISHGHSTAWHRVQNFIEKDFGLDTLELAQEANRGRTVLQKLNDESSRCGFAVIVMTGDDAIGNEIRARENVIHEIGFFQGKYGLHNIALLHEEGVNIPSNFAGLVYIPFPKDGIEAALAQLQRELKVYVG